MKNLIKQIAIIVFVFIALPSFAQEKQLVALQFKFPENMDSVLKQKLDSSVVVMKQQFNQESTRFKLAEGDEQVAHTFMVDLSKVKVVSKKGRKTAYWINGIGMTVIPVTAFALGATAPIMVNYMPQNVVKSSLTTPESFSGKEKRTKMNLCTGVLFTNDVKVRNKLAGRVTKRLYKELKKLDGKELSNAGTSASVYTGNNPSVNQIAISDGTK